MLIQNFTFLSFKGELSWDRLYTMASETENQLRRDLSRRNQRLPEFMDFKFLSDWLLRVRGL